jgi:hypothetical protein
MAHKYANVLAQVVFSTKERRNLVPDESNASCGSSGSVPSLRDSAENNESLPGTDVPGFRQPRTPKTGVQGCLSAPAGLSCRRGGGPPERVE